MVYSNTLKENPGPMIIKKAMSFYDEMKITNKCTFSEGNKKITSKNIGQ